MTKLRTELEVVEGEYRVLAPEPERLPDWPGMYHRALPWDLFVYTGSLAVMLIILLAAGYSELAGLVGCALGSGIAIYAVAEAMSS